MGSVVGKRGRERQLQKARNSRCRQCALYRSAINVCLFGRGNVLSPIMLVGEAPGRNEAQTGIVFSGMSGKWVDSLLRKLHIENQVYISNAVRCRPPDNRTPTEKEIETCNQYLKKEISIVNPSVLVVMGRTARSAIFGFEEDVEKVYYFGRKFYTSNGYGSFQCCITYHPAYCLRAGEPVKTTFEETLKWARQFVRRR